MDKLLRNTVVIIAIGTIAWLIAGAVFLVLESDTKYVWTCVCGAALGVFGIRYTIRRAHRSGI
jgi:glycopeptide antibiotics resistance protein